MVAHSQAVLGMSEIHCIGTYTNRASEVHKLPPSLRFPPLREGNLVGRMGSPPLSEIADQRTGVAVAEGNRARYSVPPARRGKP